MTLLTNDILSMKKNLFLTTVFSSFVVPVLVHADAISKFGQQITDVNKTVVSAFATLFMALAMVAFFYGMVEFILASRDGESKGMQNGKQFMLWSVIGLFVMFSIYGLIKFGQGILGIQNSTSIVIPSFQIGGGGNNTSGTVDPLGPNDTNPTGVVTPVSSSAIQTCINNGSSRATCECEARGGAWSFTDNSCYTGGVSNGSGNNTNPTGSSAIDTCIANGSPRATCECEARGGAMSTDGECYTGGQYQPTNNTNPTGGSGSAPSAIDTCIANGSPRATCECEARGGAMGSDGTCSN